MSVQIAHNLAELQARLAQADDKLMQAQVSAATEAGLFLEHQLAENSPVGHSGLYQKAHAYAGPVMLFDSVTGFVGNPLIYAAALEDGSRPHFPPVQALLPWVEYKLDLTGDEAEQAALMIARKIASKGTEGKKVYATTFEKNKQNVVAMYERHAEQALQELMQ